MSNRSANIESSRGESPRKGNARSLELYDVQSAGIV